MTFSFNKDTFGDFIITYINSEIMRFKRLDSGSSEFNTDWGKFVRSLINHGIGKGSIPPVGGTVTRKQTNSVLEAVNGKNSTIIRMNI